MSADQSHRWFWSGLAGDAAVLRLTRKGSGLNLDRTRRLVRSVRDPAYCNLYYGGERRQGGHPAAALRSAAATAPIPVSRPANLVYRDLRKRPGPR
jgi:hypothetical protein